MEKIWCTKGGETELAEDSRDANILDSGVVGWNLLFRSVLPAFDSLDFFRWGRQGNSDGLVYCCACISAVCSFNPLCDVCSASVEAVPYAHLQ